MKLAEHEVNKKIENTNIIILIKVFISKAIFKEALIIYCYNLFFNIKNSYIN